MNTTIDTADTFHTFKTAQREVWAGFAANEGFTTVAAGELVAFAGIASGERVLDVACGTGVVAVTAARAGARVSGLDLTPSLLERAEENALIAGVHIDFTEGDVEHLPYPDASFDVVVSQFGHIFAPRPAVAISEMLRVLRPGGRIAFSTWPPEHVMGRLFALIARSMPKPPEGAARPAPVPQWGDPGIVADRLGTAVNGLKFGRSSLVLPALSQGHVLTGVESSFGPLKTLLARLDENAPERAKEIRDEIRGSVADAMEGTIVRQHYLMTSAVKNFAIEPGDSK